MQPYLRLRKDACMWVFETLPYAPYTSSFVVWCDAAPRMHSFLFKLRCAACGCSLPATGMLLGICLERS